MWGIVKGGGDLRKPRVLCLEGVSEGKKKDLDTETVLKGKGKEKPVGILLEPRETCVTAEVVGKMDFKHFETFMGEMVSAVCVALNFSDSGCNSGVVLDFPPGILG